MRILRITAIGLCLTLLLAPIIGLLYLLVYPPPDPWGQPLASFWEMLQNPFLQKQTWNSLLLSIMVAFGATFWGGFLAWMEQRHRYWGVALAEHLKSTSSRHSKLPNRSKPCKTYTRNRYDITFGIYPCLVFPCSGHNTLRTTRM